jgi:hypothetical protein
MMSINEEHHKKTAVWFLFYLFGLSFAYLLF